MFGTARGVLDGGLLGAMQTSQEGAHVWVERIVGRGWGKLNLHSASALVDQGQASVNLVAAIPSLHAGLTAAVSAFLWRRVQRKWRPLLVAYPLIMAFTLVYTAEHYVVDILLGWALAWVVVAALNRYEARRSDRQAAVRTTLRRFPSTTVSVPAARLDIAVSSSSSTPAAPDRPTKSASRRTPDVVSHRCPVGKCYESCAVVEKM